jgi:AcrR family transcriptional regulator
MKSAISSSDDPGEKLKHAVATDFHFLSKNSDLYTTILKESYTADKNKQNEFLNATHPIFQLYSALIDEGVKAGKFMKDTDPLSTAISLMGMIESLAFMNKLFNHSLGTCDELAERIVKTFLKGIEKR